MDDDGQWWITMDNGCYLVMMMMMMMMLLLLLLLVLLLLLLLLFNSGSFFCNCTGVKLCWFFVWCIDPYSRGKVLTLVKTWWWNGSTVCCDFNQSLYQWGTCLYWRGRKRICHQEYMYIYRCDYMYGWIITIHQPWPLLNYLLHPHTVNENHDHSDIYYLKNHTGLNLWLSYHIYIVWIIWRSNCHSKRK